MRHGLDHIVHAVRDLDAAAEFYASAGFTVGARDRHAWGTHNRIVQLKFGVSPDMDGEGMTLNGLRFEVADIAQTEALHRQNGIASRRHVGRLVVPPYAAHGATLIFETAKEG
jgi:catechol 2,3-dioxygenase-like lactoylglutathione lyase family enzyme